MTQLTEDEQAVYDRQLRVWGVDVQKRLHEARMLIVNCTGLAAEVAKNVVLAGIGSMTLQHENKQPRPTANFLACAAGPDCDVAHATAAELQEMNPLVKVTAAEADSTEGGYHVALLVVSSTTGLADAVAWADRFRAQGTRVFVAASRGTTSWFFEDLGDDHFFSATDKAHADKGVQQTSFATMSSALQGVAALPARARSLKRTHRLIFVLHALHAFEAKHGRPAAAEDIGAVQAELKGVLGEASPLIPQCIALLQDYVGGVEELPAVNAVLGGLLANEVIKAVGGKGEPLRNVVLYCLRDGHACVECVGC